jgi:hypothetical protein
MALSARSDRGLELDLSIHPGLLPSPVSMRVQGGQKHFGLLILRPWVAGAGTKVGSGLTRLDLSFRVWPACRNGLFMRARAPGWVPVSDLPLSVG